MIGAAVQVRGGEEIVPLAGRRTGQDDFEYGCRGDTAGNLRNDVADRFFGFAVTGDNETAGDGRIEMTAGNTADRISHRQYAQAHGKGDGNETRRGRRKQRSPAY